MKYFYKKINIIRKFDLYLKKVLYPKNKTENEEKKAIVSLIE